MPLNLVGSLQAPKNADPETVADEVEGFVSGLLGLVDVDADPLSSREHILLSNIVAASWNAGRDLDLATLVGQVQQPPLRKLGVFDLDTFFPPKDRTALALRLNGLLVSPSFAAWTQGVPFDIDRLLTTDDGKPAAAIVTIAHLSDAERQFVASLLLGKLVTWMRRQSGTTDLRALVYMDEVAGYVPPTAEPPSKKPILTLLKQARRSVSASCCRRRTRSTSTTRRSRTPARGWSGACRPSKTRRDSSTGCRPRPVGWMSPRSERRSAASASESSCCGARGSSS